jgi:hypothetical protein
MYLIVIRLIWSVSYWNQFISVPEELLLVFKTLNTTKMIRHLANDWFNGLCLKHFYLGEIVLRGFLVHILKAK